MNFNKFKNAQFERRTATVKVPSLSAFADEGAEVCEIEVQGLTGEEIAKANERVRRNRNVVALAEKMVGDDVPEIVDALKEKMGMSDDAPDKFVERVAVLEFGLVGRPMDQPACVKFANAFPVPFNLLTNKIFELTGVGQIPLGE